MDMQHRPGACTLIQAAIFGIALTATTWCASAQSVEPGRLQYIARVWDTDRGLPDYAVNSFVQTPDGYLWAATFEGLARFDGARFETVNHRTTPEFPGKGTSGLLLDRHGRMWVATDNGIACLSDGHWHTYAEAGGNTISFATNLVEDNRETIFATSKRRVLRFDHDRFEVLPLPDGIEPEAILVTVDGELWAYDAKHLEHFQNGGWQSVTLPEAISAGGLQGAGQARDGSVWLAGASVIQKFRDGKWSTQFRIPSVFHLSNIVRLLEDTAGNLWVGDSLVGLFEFRPDGRLLRFTSMDGLPHPAIRAIFEDREQNVWVGTHGGGMVRFRARAVRHFDDSDGLTEMMVDTVAERASGSLLVSTYGGGLLLFDESRLRFSPLTGYAGIEKITGKTVVSSTLDDGAGTIWAGVQSKGLYRFSQAGAKESNVGELGGYTAKALFQDSRGTMWIGTEKGLASYQSSRFTKYDSQSRTGLGSISAIAEDRHREIWAGGIAGLFRIRSGRFEKFLMPDGRDFGAITSLHGNKDSLWIGVENGGLYRLQDSALTSYGPDQGLPSSRITGITEDDQGRLWMATFEDGLLCVPVDSFDAVDARRSRLLDLIWLRREDGLGTNQFRSGYQPVLWKGRDGRLWFATLKGLVMADPQQVQRNLTVPPVLIEAVGVNGQRIAVANNRSDPLRLPAGSASLKFFFTAPSFADPERVRFQYQLEGPDSRWVDTSDRSADFGEVKPGKYAFRVRAANRDGLWNPTPAVLDITVASFIWETWWFRFLGASSIAFLSAAVVYSAQRKKLQRKTDQLRVEQALRYDVERLQSVLSVSEERFAKAFNASPNALSIATLDDGRFVDVNTRFSQVTGLEGDVVIGRTLAELGMSDSAALMAQVQAALAHGPVHGLGAELRDRSGKLHHLIVSAEVIELAGVQHMLASLDDITERKLLEQQLIHAQKMESTGRLAGGIAHDFNNLLTVINGYSDMLLRRSDLEVKTLERLRLIRQAGERAAELTGQLLAFSRKQLIAPKALNLNAVVTETEAMLRRLLPENIEMRTRLEPELGLVQADPGQMNQVLLNLSLNARDAMPAGGHLTIETANMFLDSEYGSPHSASPEPYVVLAVTDTGVGMDESVRNHIFEPFFTTKAAGTGTGLGLASAYGIVQQNHGWIEVDSQPGKGSTFKIYFPRLDSAIREYGTAKHTERSLRGSETILLVEDRHDVRTFAREVLESGGYRVLEAPDGAAATKVAGQHPGPIDLLLTDVVMPGMDGMELYSRLVLTRGDTKVLYMSGYAERMIDRKSDLQSRAFLEKPLTPNGLLIKVRETLDRHDN
jgi:PAS domain S-box-containing protein